MGLIEGLRREFSFIQGNYLILVISWILMDFAMELPGTYYPRFVEELGGTPSIVGIIGFASLIALAAVQFPGGYLADKYGRRWLISTMTFGVAVSYLFYAVAPSWHTILIGAVFSSFCLIYQPALLAMTADSLPSERRGMGFSIIMLITRVATTPGPVAAGLLYASYGLVNGMRIGYFIVVGFFLTAATLRSRLKETIEDPGEIRFKDFLGSYPTALKEGTGVWQVVPRSMFWLFLAGIAGTFSFAMAMPYFLFYGVYDLHISEGWWWILMTSLWIMMIAFALPCGKLVDKIGRIIPMLLSYILIIPAIWLFLYGNIFSLFAALSLFGLTQILSMSAYSSLQADLVPREQRGKVIGFTNFTNYILMALGQLTGGVLYERVSHQLPFLLLLTFLIPQFVLTMFLVREAKKREV